MKNIIFENSPLQEVVIGVQFNPIVDSNSIISEFYQIKKGKFPRLIEDSPIPHIIEKFDSQNIVTFQNGYYSRKHFVEQSEHKLIQIQSDKLLFNLRILDKKNDYPFFDNIRIEFLNHLNDLDNIYSIINNIDQLEITYLNHIPIVEFNEDNYDLSKIFINYFPSNTVKNFNCTYIIPIQKINGNLTLKLQDGLNRATQNKVVVLELTIRGNKTEKQSMDDWFNESHNILFDFFLNSISESAKKLWKLKKSE